MPSVSSPTSHSPPRRDTSTSLRTSPHNPSASRAIDSSRDRRPPDFIPYISRSPPNGMGVHPILRHQRSSHLPQIPSNLNQSQNRSAPASPHIAPLLIDFVIVGGGLAGLACAYALARSGHAVRVLEQVRNLTQPGGGIRVPPNMTNILVEWGLGPDLAKATAKCRGSTFHSLDTGEAIGHLQWSEDVLKETGADFLLMHHSDLLRLLYNLAISAGATVDFDSHVTSIEVDEIAEKVDVKLKSGRVFSADVVVGADGFQSIVRSFVVGEADSGVDTGISVYTTTVPTDRLKAEPELFGFHDKPEWPMWMGSSRSVLVYPIRGGREFTIHLFWPDKDLREEDDSDYIDDSEFIDEGFDMVCSTNIVRTDACVEKIRRLFSLSPFALRTKYVKREPPSEWVHESGRVVLIGEAAHPMMPCTIHNGSLAVEDAAVLGSLFSRLRTYDQIPELLEAFQDLRHDRCHAVRLSELNNAALVWLPPGPERDARDAGMKEMMKAGHDHWDEGMLREQWDTISEVFGYNAREAAEDWWVNWGLLRENSKSMTAWQPLTLMFEVTETTAQVEVTG